MLTVEEIYPKVAIILADVLDMDESKIQLKSFLMNDLNAESIDYLDIMFRLEREFKVKIPRGQIEENVRGTLSEDKFEQNGVITPEGLEVLKSYLSEVPANAFKSDLKVSEIPTLFTVETLCKLVEKAQQEGAKTE